MIKQGGGKIIKYFFLIAVTGGESIPAYRASKGGIAQLTQALINGWAKYSIKVNSIAPGYFVTDKTEPFHKNKGHYQEITSKIPSGR